MTYTRAYLVKYIIIKPSPFVYQVIEEDKLQENSHVQGTYLLEELAKLRDEFACVGDVRGKGLMVGIELVADKVSS